MSDVIDDILRREGGWVDNPADRGGPTNRGITLATLSGHLGREATVDELKALTEADARAIYQDLYVSKPGFGVIGSERIRDLMVDMAVNHGPANAVKILQRALGLKDDGVFGPLTRQAISQADYGRTYFRLCAERVRFYGHIINNDHSQAVFAAGWLNRAAEFIEHG